MNGKPVFSVRLPSISPGHLTRFSIDAEPSVEVDPADFVRGDLTPADAVKLLSRGEIYTWVWYALPVTETFVTLQPG